MVEATGPKLNEANENPLESLTLAERKDAVDRLQCGVFISDELYGAEDFVSDEIKCRNRLVTRRWR